LPGFRALSLFGSLAEGRADGYSDIDLIVTTDDLAAARESLLGLLETVSPLESCWVMSLRPDEWNPTIVFAEESYYHKLDLGLVAAGAANPTIPPEQTTVLITGAAHCAPIRPCQHQVYMPPRGSVGHFFLGECLGGTRYLKARKRGQLFTCYRFVSAAADWCLRALYAAVTKQYSWHAKLATGEYLALDRLDGAARGQEILGALNYATPAHMDNAFCAIMRQLYDLCREIARDRGEPFSAHTFRRMLLFLHRELGVAPSEAGSAFTCLGAARKSEVNDGDVS